MADNVAITAGSGTSVATDDVAGIHFQRVKLVDGTADSAAAIPGDAANGLDVDVTRVQGTVAVSAAALPLPSGAATAAKQPALGTAGTPAAEVISVQGVASMTALKVDGSAATQPVSGTVTASNTAGNVAHDGVDSGNPLKIGARARSTDIGAVAPDDRTDLIADLAGKLITLPYSIPENSLSGVTAAITGTSDTAVIAAQGVGVRICVTSLMVTNSHATVGTVVEIKDNTTVVWRGYAAPAGGGFAIAFPKPLRLAANVALNAANVTTGSNTYVAAAGYKAA